MPPTFAVCFAVFINLNRTPRLLIGVVICRAGGILFSTIFKGEFAVLWSSCSPVLLSVSEHSRDHVEFYLWTMCNISLSKKVVYCNAPAREQPRRTFMQTWGPYINDVYTIFRIFDPLSPLFCILARFILSPRNLPYYVCIWVTPSPLSV